MISAEKLLKQLGEIITIKGITNGKLEITFIVTDGSIEEIDGIDKILEEAKATLMKAQW
jgi:hypothetical protein